MQPQQPVINDPDVPTTSPDTEIIDDPDLPPDTLVDDVAEPSFDDLPDVTD